MAGRAKPSRAEWLVFLLAVVLGVLLVLVVNIAARCVWGC